MRVSLKLLIPVFFLVIFSDAKAIGKVASLEHKPDTAILVYQRFYFDSLLSELDTQIVQITIQPGERTFQMTDGRTGQQVSYIIKGVADPFSLEREPNIADQKCRAEKDASVVSSTLGVMLLCSCWSESNGMVWSDSGFRQMFSMEVGLIMEKGSMTQSGRVIYSVNGNLIPRSTRTELIKK